MAFWTNGNMSLDGTIVRAGRDFCTVQLIFDIANLSVRLSVCP